MSSLNLAHFVNWTALKERCAGEGCSVTLLRHSLMARRTGIYLEDKWLCSAGCFRGGVESSVRELQDVALKTKPQRVQRIPLGLLLLTRGYISAEQLRTAEELQRHQGGELGEILCQLGFANEREVSEAVATQWGGSVYSAKTCPSGIEAQVPAALMEMLSMVPVYYVAAANKLLIGFVHGIDHAALESVEKMTSRRTEPCFITAGDCSRRIRQLAGRNLEVRFERMSSPSEIAGIVQSYAFQIGAERVRLVICGGHLWVRLNRNQHPTDLLFGLDDSHGRDRGYLLKPTHD